MGFSLRLAALVVIAPMLLSCKREERFESVCQLIRNDIVEVDDKGVPAMRAALRRLSLRGKPNRHSKAFRPAEVRADRAIQWVVSVHGEAGSANHDPAGRPLS